MSLLIATVGAAFAAGMAVYAVALRVERLADARASLRRLDDFDAGSSLEQDLLAPLANRALSPLAGRLIALARRLTPEGYVASVRRKLVLSGRPAQQSLERYLLLRLFTVGAVPLLVVVWVVSGPLDGRLGYLALGLFLIAIVVGPDVVLRRRVDERKSAMQASLPDVLDLLTISVEAGLGFEQALDRTTARVPGPLSDEFTRMLGEMRAGSSRSDALRALDERTSVPEVKSFVLAILQADTFGVSIGRILRSQADEMRIRRRQLAQERAMKAPVKMLFPMVFCIFPTVFVVVLGPAAINLYEQLLKGK